MMSFLEFMSKRKKELESAIKEIDRNILEPIIKDVFDGEIVKIDRIPLDDYHTHVGWSSAEFDICFNFTGNFDADEKCSQLQIALNDAFKKCANLKKSKYWFLEGTYKDKVNLQIKCITINPIDDRNPFIMMHIYVQTK